MLTALLIHGIIAFFQGGKAFAGSVGWKQALPSYAHDDFNPRRFRRVHVQKHSKQFTRTQYFWLSGAKLRHGARAICVAMPTSLQQLVCWTGDYYLLLSCDARTSNFPTNHRE